MRLGWYWTRRERTATAMPRGFQATLPSALDGGASGPDSARAPVYPPALLDDDFSSSRNGLRSLLPRIGELRDWLNTGWTQPDAGASTAGGSTRLASTHRLGAARQAFGAALADLRGAEADSLAAQAQQAASLRELWHLRNTLFTLVSITHCESVALQRIGALDVHFPPGPPRPNRASAAPGPDHPLREPRP